MAEAKAISVWRQLQRRPKASLCSANAVVGDGDGRGRGSVLVVVAAVMVAAGAVMAKQLKAEAASSPVAKECKQRKG